MPKPTGVIGKTRTKICRP